MPPFPGFPEEGLKFLRALKRNNRREWFQPRKEIYETQVKAPMVELVTAVNSAMVRFAPMYTRDPRAAIFRVYRDTRFSNDKTPYKTHIGAIFPRQGMGKLEGAGLYFHVSSEEIEIAGGVYMPEPEVLRLIRQHLADHGDEFRAIVRGRTLRKLLGEVEGEKAARIPKGFACDHPEADLIRYKQVLFDLTLDPAVAATPKLLPEIVSRFRAMAPFIEFLNRPLVEAGRKPRPARLHTFDLR